MSKKRRQFSAEFKTKVVLELLEGEQTLNQVASKYDVIPKSLQQWKKQFLENAALAFEPAKAVKEYKDEIKSKEAEIEELQKALGKTTIERDWVVKKLKSLGSSNRRSLVEPKLTTVSMARQCELIGIHRSTLYYKPKGFSQESIRIMHGVALKSENPLYSFLYFKAKAPTIKDAANLRNQSRAILTGFSSRGLEYWRNRSIAQNLFYR